MITAHAGSSDRVRKTFADQFEPDRTSFIYRRSQKGEAIRVSAEERGRFIDDFDRKIRQSKWIFCVAQVFVVGGIVVPSSGGNLAVPQAALFAAISVVMISYFAYYQWAWAAPTRALAGRTPIAGERSPDEVRRLRYYRTTYGQLASAAFGGLVIPFIASSRENAFSGWNRLWLLFGGGIILFAAVQAFRKWRFEQNESYKNLIPSSSRLDIKEPAQDVRTPSRYQFWRYLPLAGIILGVAFIAYTSAGKQLAKQPSFWSLLMIGCAGWSLFTVVRGFTKGQIQPFARGFYNTYERETEPRRFWASMAWNSIFGCCCLWIAFAMNRDTTAQNLRDRCYNAGHKHRPQEALQACNELIAGRGSLGDWSRADVFLDRGIAYAAMEKPGPAIAAYTAAIRLQPNYPEAHYDRALAYEQIGDVSRALSDYGVAIQQRPRNPDAHLNRGLIYLNMGRFEEAISDFTRSDELAPKNEWALANRGLAYVWKKDMPLARQDFSAVRAINPTNQVLLHGEGLMYMSEGDLNAAIGRLSSALVHNPSDKWALRMRANAYQQMGDYAQAQADKDKLLQLSEGTKRTPAK